MAERKFKLRHLAQRLGVTIGAVGHVINNRRMSKTLRSRLAALLGVPLSAILDKSKVVKLKPKGRPSSSSSGNGASSLAASSRE